jgi:hypothetical protein
MPEFNRLHHSCKKCVLAVGRKRYAEEPGRKEAHRAKMAAQREDPIFVEDARLRCQRFYESVGGRAKTLFKSAQRRVENKEAFDITADWIEERIRKGFCEVTGIAFDFKQHPVYSKNPYSPSIDRIDSTKDYCKENVRFVIWQVNMMRGETSDDEMLEICYKFIEGIKNGRCEMGL